MKRFFLVQLLLILFAVAYGQSKSIEQTVNSKMAIFSKKGSKYSSSGDILYGPVATNNVFRGFGGPCEERNSGDAVVRYDQLANRWLIVMPIMSRLPPGDNEPPAQVHGQPAQESKIGNPGQPGKAEALYIPPKPKQEELSLADSLRRLRRKGPSNEGGFFCMCYAISTGPDPFGPYYRYSFVRPLFPDYHRLGVWPDGYYVTTSSGDDVIQKHAFVVERDKMLEGKAAKEICLVLDSVNFLNSADLDGYQLPPEGAPNILMATGGTQLYDDFSDSCRSLSLDLLGQRRCKMV